MNRQELVNLEMEIVNITNEIDILDSKGGFSKFFKSGKLERRLEKLREKQFYQIDAFLLETNKEYQEIVQKNYALLETSEIQFTVYTTDMSLWGSYVKQINGYIHPNGYSYLTSSRSNVAFLPFDSMRFPSKLDGTIDYWGKVDIKTIETNYAFFKRVPKKFAGSVDSNGNIHLENVENEYEVMTQGKWIMGKLIANHFEHDEFKNERFQNNKAVLVDMVQAFRNTIKDEIKR